MPFRFVLISAVVLQVAAALLALRLNWKYRSHSAWLMISAAAWLVAIQQLATLLIVWHTSAKVIYALPLWTACLSALLVSVLMVGGMALIEPLFKELARAQEVLRRENERLEETVQATEDELRMARKIQQDLQPKDAPHLPGLNIAGRSVPAQWTSGDFFDYVRVDENTLSVVVGDVSGHGLGPALLMSATRAYLRAVAQTRNDAGMMLTLANRALARDVENGRFVTAFLLTIDLTHKTIKFAGAGQDAVLLNARGESSTLKGLGPPLGALPDATFKTSDPLPLNEGDLLVLVSDGINETESLDGQQFGVERILEVVRAARNRPASEIIDRLFQAVRQFAKDASQRDDNTAVIVKIGEES